MHVLEEFHNVFGLMINVEKSKVFRIGAWRGSTIFLPGLGFAMGKQIFIIGYPI